MDCQNYIKAELLILVPVLYLIGAGLKKSAFPRSAFAMQAIKSMGRKR